MMCGRGTRCSSARPLACLASWPLGAPSQLSKVYTLRANMFGMDINKRGVPPARAEYAGAESFVVVLLQSPVRLPHVCSRLVQLVKRRPGVAGTAMGEKKVPESLGLAVGVVYLVCIVLFQLLHSHDAAATLHWVHRGGGGAALKTQPIADAWLVDYNAALATICFMLFLGFADDVLDIPWRVKLLLPMLAALPLIVAYGGGYWRVAVPLPLRGVFSLPELPGPGAGLLCALSVRPYIMSGPAATCCCSNRSAWIPAAACSAQLLRRHVRPGTSRRVNAGVSHAARFSW